MWEQQKPPLSKKNYTHPKVLYTFISILWYVGTFPKRKRILLKTRLQLNGGKMMSNTIENLYGAPVICLLVIGLLLSTVLFSLMFKYAEEGNLLMVILIPLAVSLIALGIAGGLSSTTNEWFYMLGKNPKITLLNNIRELVLRASKVALFAGNFRPLFL
jgi:hypothetical protein